MADRMRRRALSRQRKRRIRIGVHFFGQWTEVAGNTIPPLDRGQIFLLRCQEHNIGYLR